MSAPRRSWRVRPGGASDGDVLRALWRSIDELHAERMPSFFRSAPAGPPGDDRGDAAIRRTLTSAHESLLVAEDEREIVRGLSHVLLYDTPSGVSRVPARRAHLDSLVVEAAHRRGGCGRALVEASAAWARRKGAVKLLLTVWSGNREAEAFYAALGYQPVSQVLGIDL